ncbi:MAG: peptidoglycan DD-metalloendopeptidase family protein [Roseburia sp.]|nr:peptidoglycan DD-metalloendopeptidase family protein [Roseburia sp.]
MVKLEITTKMKIRVACVGLLFLGMLYIAASQYRSLGQGYQQVWFNDEHICDVGNYIDAKEVAKEVRKELALASEDKLAIDYRITTTAAEELFVPLATEAELEDILREQLIAASVNGGVKSYTIEIEGYSATFASLDEVKSLFAGVKAEADENQAFEPVIKKQAGHVKGIMTASLEPIVPNVWETEVIPEEKDGDGISAGVTAALMDSLEYAKANPYKDTYQTGILDIEFIESIEIYESFANPEELADVETELVEVTKEKETNKIYVVQSGDSLSLIAYENDTTVASIMALNGFKDMNQIIRIEDELIIAVPEPDLMLRVTKGEVYEEDYRADPIIIPNDEWYTTKEVVHYEGTVGHRERNDIVTIENGVEVNREMIHENVMVVSEPAVIERGTIIPPTYIKPINGGRKTSNFGWRWGRLHKGVDWGVPVGTKVFASSGGTVIRADYNGAYGLCVLISHPDGRMTRYAHNSKLLVSVGQYVEQGETIALSGNTGRSTGPHVHFEIIINGSPVDPLKYIN